MSLIKIRKKVAQIKKKNSHIPINEIRKDLAEHLGYASWADLVYSPEDIRAERLRVHGVKSL